ncbi:MAG: tRNA (N6-threonylcarbamoyladenosine(37)-N6)-methyltransferase TrmO [Bacteroidales bacterium]|nr:tRNA (N6-threonylcarbamoyladenosine(37)-N6)-methyltransferase TrmO [Bacteroidales bacterium]
MNVIAHIETPFVTKFGVPRQPGIVHYTACVVFEPEYRNGEALRGLEEFDYIWLLWQFHLAAHDGTWSPTVRPPRLGGNRRMGVFATRSPFRPNNIGLSAVRLIDIVPVEGKGKVLLVDGADMVNGTPILDIKPYVTYTDSYPNARSGFAQERPKAEIVVDATAVAKVLPPKELDLIVQVLQADPRPQYQKDNDRVYAMQIGQREVRFRVDDGRAIVISTTEV